MDAHVTERASLVLRIQHVMSRRWQRLTRLGETELAGAVVALETDGVNDRPSQEARIHGPVGRVTRLAAFNAHAGVFKNERPAFVGVTPKAWLFPAEVLAHQARPRSHAPGGRKGTVRVMAIGATHHTLVQAVVRRHRKFGLHRAMASGTKIDLIRGQQKLRRLRAMNRMTVRADNIRFGVSRALNIHLGQLFAMAGETSAELFIGLHD
jgi:hypothetical protein